MFTPWRRQIIHSYSLLNWILIQLYLNLFGFFFWGNQSICVGQGAIIRLTNLLMNFLRSYSPSPGAKFWTCSIVVRLKLKGFNNVRVLVSFEMSSAGESNAKLLIMYSDFEEIGLISLRECGCVYTLFVHLHHTFITSIKTLRISLSSMSFTRQV